MTSERAVDRTRPYGGDHNPQPDGLCEHRWANRVRRKVHCGYAEGYAAALAAPRGEPPEPGPVIDVERLATAMTTVYEEDLFPIKSGDWRYDASLIATEYARLAVTEPADGPGETT